jgi:hypothetical protein
MHVHVGVGDHTATVLARLVAGHVFFFTFLAVNWVGIFEKFSVAEVAYDAFGSGHFQFVNCRVVFNMRRPVPSRTPI